MMENELVRLSKLMGERGICSRREADVYIANGQVLVDGIVISELGTKVHPNVQITLKKEAIRHQESKVTIILNKPIGFVSTQPEKGYIPAIALIIAKNQCKQDTKPFLSSHTKNLNVAGRLDIDSQGLLLFSQDGTVVKKIIGPDSDLEKEYIVEVEGVISEQTLQKLRFGLTLDGKALKRAFVEQKAPQTLCFILKEGKKRQIRRMCEIVGLKVIILKRVRIGRIILGNLPEGKWRFLKPHEQI